MQLGVNDCCCIHYTSEAIPWQAQIDIRQYIVRKRAESVPKRLARRGQVCYNEAYARQTDAPCREETENI